MKNISLLFIVIAGVALFMIGAIPHYDHPAVSHVLMGAGAALIAIFYLVTLVQVIRSSTISNKRRIVWIIIIICAPLVGNLLFIIVHDAMISRQVAK
jgi:hypothetical protein